MPPKLQRLTSRFTRKVVIWASVTMVMGLGVLLSLSHLAATPAHETMRANSDQQRVIIDPVTGIVSGISHSENASPFEVAEESEEAPASGEEGPEIAPSEEVPSTEEEALAAEEDVAPVAEEAPVTSLEALTTSRNDGGVPRVPRNSSSLVMAPAPEISEKIGDELVPKRGTAAKGKEATRASKLYARSFTRKEGQKLVAIVVTDVGFSNETLKQVLSLPGEVSVGFSPYATDAKPQIDALRAKGHEVWAMLPMMGARYPQDDPGPLGMINALTVKGALTRLHSLMASTMGAVGFILPPDETFSENVDLWNAVRDEIDARGLYILSTHPTRDAKALNATRDQEKIIRRSDIMLDSTPGAAFIKSKLAGIKEASVNEPELVVLVSARPQALRLLAEWMNSEPLGENAFFVPLSGIYAEVAKPIEPPKPEGGGGH